MKKFAGIVLSVLLAEAKPVEEIARAVSVRRNEIRLEAYDSDPDGLARVKQPRHLRGRIGPHSGLPVSKIGFMAGRPGKSPGNQCRHGCLPGLL